MSFTQQAWDRIDPIYQAILAHPFNQELTAGTLPTETFRFYIQQDALYLVDFGKALATVAARVPDASDTVSFLDFAKGAIVAEREVHDFYLERFGAKLDAPHSPTCRAYTSYLLATAATQTVEEGMAALLPCFWIYHAVGTHIHGRAAPGNPYQAWIDTYAHEDFGQVVTSAIGITDVYAAATTEAVRQRMLEAFVTSTRLEWYFWNSAYEQEAWRP